MTTSTQKKDPDQGTDAGRIAFRPRVDLVTFEVLRHRLWQINDEQGQALLSVSGSPVASEANDFNIAIADRAGNIVAAGPYILLHLSALSLMFEHAQRVVGADRIRDGDMYLVNDPWSGAVHQNDVGLIAPVFRDGQLVAWVGSVVHQVDVGGPQPGSWNPFARDAFDEAPRYRFLKVVDAGTPQPEVIATYVTNSRLSHLLELDLRAQIASANVARSRLGELFERYGTTTVLDVMQDVLDYSEVLFRQKLLELPNGSWHAEDYLDHNGRDEHVHTIRLTLEKVDDRLVFDFRKTDPQTIGFVNCTYSSLLGGVFGAVLPYLCTNIPWNAGVMRAVTILSDEGAINNARFPAAVGAGPVNAGWVTHNAAAVALATLLASTTTHRDSAMAIWTGASFLYNLFGEDQYGRTFGTMMLSSTLGGGGARSFGDGYNCAGPLWAPRPSVINVETAEVLFPLLYLYRRRAKDSGGAGEYRGGVSAENAVTVHGAEQAKVILSTLGTTGTSSLGISGGYPGAGSTAMLVEGAAPLDLIANHSVPSHVGEFPGKTRFLPSKCVLDLKAGDILVTVAHGGGGYGDPLCRDPNSVERDVRERLVSEAQALALCGVAFDGDRRVDHAETVKTRERIRLERTRTFDVSGTTAVACPSCHTKQGVAKRTSPLNRAGPWIALRYMGDSPDFKLEETACQACGRMLSVGVRPVRNHVPS